MSQQITNPDYVLTKEGLVVLWDLITTALGDKVDKVTGKGLSTEDYTTAEQTKLAGIATGATANTGTIEGITMNSTSMGTSGTVDLGSVLTSWSNAPSASTSQAGFVTTGDQSFAGFKTFTDNIAVYKTTGEPNIKVKRTDTGLSCSMLATVINHGIWSNGYVDSNYTFHDDGKYLIYRDDAGDITVNGHATSDALATEAIKNISRSGTTFTATRCNNTTFTFTQQDNNTWRGYQTKSYSYTWSSVSSGGTRNISAGDFGFSTPSGYTAIGIVRYYTGNTGMVATRVQYSSTSTDTVMSLRNVTSSSISSASASVTVLYLQTGSP